VSKGSKRRPTNEPTYHKEYDRIFGKKKEKEDGKSSKGVRNRDSK
jgi:hypothetical protein